MSALQEPSLKSHLQDLLPGLTKSLLEGRCSDVEADWLTLEQDVTWNPAEEEH